MYLRLFKNKYLYISLIALVFFVILLVLILRSEEETSRLTLKLEDEMISSGQTTNLQVRVENLNELIQGTIRVESDGNLEITHPDESLLEFELYKDEMIQRVLQINATTTAFRTDYEITAYLDYDNKIINESTILTVQRS